MEQLTIERGAELFDYDSRGRTLKPQQYDVGAALDRHAGITAICMSRRVAKTESVLLWVFAMMSMHKGLQVAFTMATTREAARAKFLSDVLPVMEELAELSDDVHLLRGAGYESVTINGSHFTVVAPSDKAFRSKAFDIIIVDEAGAAEPQVQDELLPALLPTLDTSDFGMLILMGTAGDYRAGNLLWEALHDADSSVVDLTRDDIDVERLADWDYAREMLELHHPGVGTLTTADRLKRNWALLKPAKFAQEYLSVWGTAGGAAGMFTEDDWAPLFLEGKLPDLPDLPRRFALGVAASEDAGAIVAAWRDSNGEGRILLIDSRPGRSWLPATARDIARKYRVPIVCDPRASQVMADVKQRIEQLRPAPRVDVQDYEDVAAAHERMKLELENGTTRHFGQQPMTDAFLAVKRTQMGAKWKFGAVNDDADITPAQAATLALRYFDAKPRAVAGSISAVAV